MFSLFIDSWFPNETLRALTWTFIHSLWQGLIAAAIAAVIIVYTRRSSARLRYNLLGSILVIFMLTAVLTFLHQQSIAVGFAVNNAQGENSAIITNPSERDFIFINETPTGFIETATAFLNKNAVWIMLLWFLFFVTKCTKLVGGLYYTSRIRLYKTHEPSPRWTKKTIELSRHIGIRQIVRLKESELIKMPAVVGFFKPVILIPLGMLTNLTPDQAETILLHELAHIRRRDYLANLIQSCMETIFFFNPAIIWISALIREEREACCDDIVMENTTAKNSYLEALVSFHENTGQASYAMALGGNKMHLLNRVKRMLTRENKKLSLMEKLVVLAGVTLLTAFTVIPKHNPIVNKKMEKATEKIEPAVYSAESEFVSRRTEGKPKKAEIKRYKSGSPIVGRNDNRIIIDTIPTPISPAKPEDLKESEFSSISIDQVKDDNRDEQTIETREKTGTKYKLKKVSGKLTYFSVDDKEISESDWSKYKEVIEKMERSASNRQVPRKPFTKFKGTTATAPLKPLKQMPPTKPFESQKEFESPRSPKPEKFKAYPSAPDTTRLTKYRSYANNKAMMKHDSLKFSKEPNESRRLIANKQREFVMRRDSVKVMNKLSLQKKTFELKNEQLLRNENTLALNKDEIRTKMTLLRKENNLQRKISQLQRQEILIDKKQELKDNEVKVLEKVPNKESLKRDVKKKLYL